MRSHNVRRREEEEENDQICLEWKNICASLCAAVAGIAAALWSDARRKRVKELFGMAFQRYVSRHFNVCTERNEAWKFFCSLAIYIEFI